MKIYRPPLPDDLPPAARAVDDLMRPVWGQDLVAIAADERRIDAMREHFAPRLDPDFAVEVTFAAPGSARRGPDALIEAWRELLSVFSSYRPRLGELIDLEDGRVAIFGEDEIATAEGIRMVVPVGAVYEVGGGLVRRARFFPDQSAARAAIA